MGPIDTAQRPRGDGKLWFLAVSSRTFSVLFAPTPIAHFSECVRAVDHLGLKGKSFLQDSQEAHWGIINRKPQLTGMKPGRPDASFLPLAHPREKGAIE